MIQRWNYETHEYDPFNPPSGRNIVLYTDDMDLPIDCTSCGKAMTFGEGFTSRELHNHMGLGYPVCSECYEVETKRQMQAKGLGHE